MVRDGMVNAIVELRRLTNANVGDTQILDETYWTDEQLQDILDEYSTEYHHIPLRATQKVVLNNTLEYYDYYWPTEVGMWIETPDTSGVFYVQNSVGANQAFGTAYTVDYRRRKISFVSNTTGGTFYLTCRAFDMNAAAAAVWLAKASHRAHFISVTLDNHRMEEDGEWRQCMDMYRAYSAKRGFAVSKQVLVDYVGNRKHDSTWRY